jgi:hypothetical protein
MLKWWRLKVRDPRATRIRRDARPPRADRPVHPGGGAARPQRRSRARRDDRRPGRAPQRAGRGRGAGRPHRAPAQPARRTRLHADEASEVIDRVEAAVAAACGGGGRHRVPGRRVLPRRGRPLPEADGRTKASRCSRTASAWCATSSGPGSTRVDCPSAGWLAAPRAVRDGHAVRARCCAPRWRRSTESRVSSSRSRPLTNRTFGAVTTVTGLLAGRDVSRRCGRGEADLLLLSPSMLKYGTETLLDDRTSTT